MSRYRIAAAVLKDTTMRLVLLMVFALGTVAGIGYGICDVIRGREPPLV